MASEVRWYRKVLALFLLWLIALPVTVYAFSALVLTGAVIVMRGVEIDLTSALALPAFYGIFMLVGMPYLAVLLLVLPFFRKHVLVSILIGLAVAGLAYAGVPAWEEYDEFGSTVAPEPSYVLVLYLIAGVAAGAFYWWVERTIWFATTGHPQEPD